MINAEYLLKTPWDAMAFGIDTYEILTLTEAILKEADQVPGHYTVKVDPLSSKKILHDFGFYYCDTLIEPYCSHDRFISFDSNWVTLSKEVPLKELLEICHGAFEYGRFHRDFNLKPALADLRYDNWLKELYHQGEVYGLLYRDAVAGFIACSSGKLLLHAIGKDYRGRGLSKYLWSAACKALFQSGQKEINSSISAANMQVVNLYISLGFKFREPKDVYHKLVVK